MMGVGPRIARRLIEEHGIRLPYDPVNYTIRRDQYAVGLNHYGGLDYPTWVLLDPHGLACILHKPWDGYIGEDVLLPVMIGSPQPATFIARCKYWDLVRHHSDIIIFGSNSL